MQEKRKLNRNQYLIKKQAFWCGLCGQFLKFDEKKAQMHISNELYRNRPKLQESLNLSQKQLRDVDSLKQ